MSNPDTPPKPATPEQPSPEWLDETASRLSEIPTPRTDRTELAMDRADLKPLLKLPLYANLCRNLERELHLALNREAAIIQFCECEMGWEFFRADMKISDNPSKSMENAMKLREFLSANDQA